jgi:hypothetical protein
MPMLEYDVLYLIQHSVTERLQTHRIEARAKRGAHLPGADCDVRPDAVIKQAEKHPAEESGTSTVPGWSLPWAAD